MGEKLSDLELRKLARSAEAGKEQARDIIEGEGFGVSVLPSGKLSFFLLYRLNGQRKRIRFGTYPQTSLAAARSSATIARAKIAQGLDPLAEREEQRNAARAAADEARRAPTVAEFAGEYLERWAKPRKRTWRQDEDKLNRDVLPVLGRMKVRDVTRRDVVALLDRITDRGAPVQANLVLAVLRKMFAFAVARDVLDENPAAGIPKPSPTRPRERTLSDDELRAFLLVLDTAPMTTTTRAGLRMILLTGQRPGEVAGARWDELNLSAGLWHLPPERTKNGRAHTVPLSGAVLAILDELRAVATSAQFVFPSPKEGQAVNDEAFAWALRHARQPTPEHPAGRLAGLEHFTPHDLRRTCRTGLAALGIDYVTAERVLNHTLPGSAVHAVYNRHDYIPQMRAALEAWAMHVRALVDGTPAAATNVVPIRA